MIEIKKIRIRVKKMIYPLLIEPIYKEMIWGGKKLNKMYNFESPFEKTGEVWNFTCRDKEMGIVSNGVYKDKKILDVINIDRIKNLGTALYNLETFPLLIKIIDANDNLSVQVHPTDDYAQKVENYDFGKNEMWYILEAPEDASLIIGLKDNITKEIFEKSIENGTVEGTLSTLPVKKGDVINIEAGLIHAITKGIVIAEIQQNSDITYRVYDYMRVGLDNKPRELHVSKALDTIDFSGKIKKEITKGLEIKIQENILTYYITNKYFSIIKYNIKTELTETTNNENFVIFTCVENDVDIIWQEEKIHLEAGYSIFIPASLGDYKIVGQGVLLKSFVGDSQKYFKNVLLESGYTQEEINNNIG